MLKFFQIRVEKKRTKPGVSKVLSLSFQREYRLALLLFNVYYQVFCVIGKLVAERWI